VEAGTGSLPPQHAVVGLRAFTHSRGFLMGEFTGADFARRVIRWRPVGVAEERELPYDELVLAPGSVTNLPGIPGLRGLALQVKSVGDAIALRDRAIRLLEQADQCEDPARRRSLLHFVIVGSSFTGTELAGELEVFLRRAVRRYANVAAADISVTLVDIADRILPNLHVDLAAFAAEKLQRRGVRLRLRTSVARVEARRVVLGDGTVLDAETVVWCAGIAPIPALAGLGLPTDGRGWVLCDPDLRVRGLEHVWAIGDCAVNPGPDGRPYPATVQAAVQQGRAVADNLARVLRGKPPVPCVAGDRGSLVPLGCRTGVARIGPLRLSGFPAWFMWRSVYLLKMPGWGRRLRVALEWSIGLFFGRDDVQLGVRGESRHPGGGQAEDARAAPWD
jgi:NADH dehydrogenase